MKWWPKILFAVCVVGTGSAVWIWFAFHHAAAGPRVEYGVRQIVKRYPTLQPLFDQATADGVLTMSEANAIIDAAEKLKAATQ